MARLRAVVVIQPPGLGGRPVVGHCSAAMANASATASSARSTSPRMRIMVAVQRPASRRKTAPRSSGILQWTDLDRALAGGRRLTRPLQGDVEVGGLDDPEATHLLLGFGERSVGHRDPAVHTAHDGGRRSGVEACAEHPGAGALHRGVQLVDLGDDALDVVTGEVDDVVAVVPDGEHVLRHGVVPFSLFWVGQRAVRRTRTGTMMAAATRWVATSTSLVAVSGGRATEGMHETAVKATAMTSNVRRACPLQRFSAATRRPPTTAPSDVIWANPAIGIISPSTCSGTPAACATAARVLIAMAATRPDSTVALSTG